MWYLTVRKTLLQLGCSVPKYDEAVFCNHHDGLLQDVVRTDVDDFCWAGTKYFAAKVAAEIRSCFKLKTNMRLGTWDWIYVKNNIKLPSNKIILFKELS